MVGATIGRTGIDFSRVNGSILAPGLGAQGARTDDLAEVFGRPPHWCCRAMSREVMAAGPDPADLQADGPKHPGGESKSRPRGWGKFVNRQVTARRVKDASCDDSPLER